MKPLKFALCATILFLHAAPSSHAAILSLNLDSFGSDPVPFTVTLDEDSMPGFLTITGAVGSNPTGDIRALFLQVGSGLVGFDLVNDVMDVTGTITERAFNTGSLSGGNNINGEILNMGFSPDLAFGFGSPGIGSDDIKNFTIKLNGLAINDIGGVAARVTSVGAPGTARSGSDKLFGDPGIIPPPVSQTVPEPTTITMIGFGLLGLAAIRRKRRG